MQHKLSLEALTIIDAIERRGSFAKAAEELDKATSALSYTVQKLEEQLGVTLFQRQGRQSVLTAAGRLLLEEGRKILKASSLLVDQVQELASGWEPRLSIAVDSTCDQTWLFGCLATFLEAHPNIELDLQESVLNGGWEALEYDRVDLVVGATGPAPSHKGFRCVRMQAPTMLLVAANHHPTAKLLHDEQALVEAIAAARGVVTHDTAAVNVERNAGLLNSRHVVYVQNTQQKIQAQLAGLGIGHLPESEIKPYLATGQLVPIRKQPDNVDCFMAWKLTNKGKALMALTDLLSGN